MIKPTRVCRQASEETQFAMSVLNASGGGGSVYCFSLNYKVQYSLFHLRIQKLCPWLGNQVLKTASYIPGDFTIGKHHKIVFTKFFHTLMHSMAARQFRKTW